ncbi:hypothetical protein ABRT01_17170 [Lentibacillus sp. L22]|uniref:hypothetical protein n=1 Tax=Lentibacillus TaxID=175304 RepID=UPI0022B0D9F2|nr:hypothetical protein [Lentibacillus daqui]
MSHELAFFTRNYSGKVNIKYGINKDPKFWGFLSLDLPFDIEIAKNFPVCEASVSYNGKGYNSVFGWIQTVDMDIKDDNYQSSFVDVGALFKGIDMPFFSFGNNPTLFDAPCMINVSNVNWTAQSFLVAVGNIIRTTNVYYVIGFEWGYEVIDDVPQIKPIKQLKMKDWNTKVDFLNREYSSWNFVKGNLSSSSK